MTVDEYFKQIDKLEALIQAKMADREKLWAIATKTTADADGMPHAMTVTDKVGGVAVKLADLSKQIDALIDQKYDLEKILEQLPPDEYKALHRHYMLGMTWEQAAWDLNISTATIYRRREKGRNLLNMIVKDID